MNVNGDVTEDDRYCAKSVKKKLFDPPDESKGIIARSICYFYWTYNLSFHKDILESHIYVSYKVNEYIFRLDFLHLKVVVLFILLLWEKLVYLIVS